MVIKKAVILLGLVAIVTGAIAQSYSGSRSRSRGRLAVPYLSNPYGYGFGRGFNAYGRSPYQLSPYLGYRAPVIRRPTLPPVTGPVERYSEIEYGEIVQMAVDAARRSNPGGVMTDRPSIIEATTGTEGLSLYKPVSTGVSDILDRGIFLLPTGEEMRLRGVSIPSSTDSNEVSRLYSKEAIQLLRNLVQGKEVYVLLDEPLRDSSGRILGTVLLADGTELNRRMIELGYGSIKDDDFAETVDFGDLINAQSAARTKRVGIWSANF